MMQNARKKLVKEGGVAPTEVEQEVAKALFDIEVSPTSEIKADVRDIHITGVKELEVKSGRTALVVQFPFRVWKTVRKIHGRLIRDFRCEPHHPGQELQAEGSKGPSAYTDIDLST